MAAPRKTATKAVPDDVKVVAAPTLKTEDLVVPVATDDDLKALRDELAKLREEKALRDEREALKAEEAAAAEAAAEEEPKKDMPPLRLQSRYRNHRIMIQPTRRIFHAGIGIEPIPGIAVRFEGPQRLFDSAKAQEQFGWTDEQRDKIERKLVTMKEFMSDFYPAPLSPLPDHLLEIARVKPEMAKMKCQALGYNQAGELEQCANQASAGRMWCAEHDPDVTRIVRGGGTT